MKRRSFLQSILSVVAAAYCPSAIGKMLDRNPWNRGPGKYELRAPQEDGSDVVYEVEACYGGNDCDAILYEDNRMVYLGEFRKVCDYPDSHVNDRYYSTIKATRL